MNNEFAPRDDERIVGVVSVYRVIREDGCMADHVLSNDGDGGELDLPTAVGMLAIGQHALLCDDQEGGR